MQTMSINCPMYPHKVETNTTVNSMLESSDLCIPTGIWVKNKKQNKYVTGLK